MISKKLMVASAVLTVMAGSSVALASTAEHFKDRTMTIIIPYGPGGTYDKYGASFANHIGNFMPGKPTVILQHMPGAGGTKAMSYLYNVAPKNGFFATVPLDNIVTNQLLRPKKMRFKAQNFNYLGSSNQTNIIIVARSDSGVTSMDAWKKGGSLIGATSGKSSSGYLAPALTMGLLNLKGRIVTGYKGSSRSIMSIEQGESQMAGFNWLAWSSKVPHWFKGDKPFARAIVQIGVVKDPDLPNVPMLSNLVAAKDRPLVSFLAASGPIGRGLAYPPKVSAEYVAAARSAFDKMNADKAFAAELKKKRLRLIPSTGQQIQKIVSNSIKEASPAVVKKVRQIIFGKPKS